MDRGDNGLEPIYFCEQIPEERNVCNGRKHFLPGIIHEFVDTVQPIAMFTCYPLWLAGP